MTLKKVLCVRVTEPLDEGVSDTKCTSSITQVSQYRLKGVEETTERVKCNHRENGKKKKKKGKKIRDLP